MSPTPEDLGGEWDRTGVDHLPPIYLFPADVDSAAELERVLAPTRDDASVMLKMAPGLRANGIAFVVNLCVLGIAVWNILGVLLNYVIVRSVSDTEIVLVLTALPLVASMVPFVQMSAVSKRSLRTVAVAAQLELPRLWENGSEYVDGVVVRRESGAYRIDLSRLGTSGLAGTRSPRRRLIRVLLVVIVAIVVLARLL